MNEMKLVEEFCAAVPPPPPDRLAEARARVTAAAGARRRGPRITPVRLAWTGALTVVSAAALVVGLGIPFGGSLAPSADAAQMLQRAAATALTQPVAGPGQYIYTEVTGPGNVILADGLPSTEPAVVKTWQSVDGTKAGAIESQNACGPLGRLQFGLLPGEALHPRPSSGPPLKASTSTGKPTPTPTSCSATILPTSWSPPASTYDGLKTLPTSPSALLAYLNAHYQALHPRWLTLSSATREYLAISDILEYLGVLPGALESAMFRALAQLPGMSVVPHVTDYAGRTGTAVAWSNDSYLFELIFNPSTYQFMGQQEVAEPGNRAGTPAGQVVWGMALLAAYVTDTAPAVSRSTEFYPILWQDFAPGVPNTN